MPYRLWKRMESGTYRGSYMTRTTPISWRRRGNESTARWNKRESDQQICKGDKWSRAKEKPSRKARTPPVAMIPQKPRSYCKLLDLSFQIWHRGTMMKSVNSEVVKHAPAEAMIQLGQCVKWLIVTHVDNYDKNTTSEFAKLDIKYGFWRLAFSDIDAWNFCCVIPQAKKVKILKTSR